MGAAAPDRMVAPNFRSSRLLGIFNVLFAAVLLLSGLCLGGYVAILPLWANVIGQAQSQMKKSAEASRTAEIAVLAAQEKEAKTEKEANELATRRKEVESRPIAGKGFLDFKTMGMNNPLMLLYSWSDVLTGLAVNVLMLVSGIGLMNWRHWGWTLGIWTAAMKIVRLILVYGFFIIVIVPPYSKWSGEAAMQMFASMGQPGPPGQNAQGMAWIYSVSYTGMGLGLMLFGAVYPAIQLWVLTRPGVRSACSGRLKLPKEPGQPC